MTTNSILGSLKNRPLKAFTDLSNLRRRLGWFLDDNLHPKKMLNLSAALSAYGTRSERVMAAPPILKLDISPLCNLKCVACLHAHDVFAGDDPEMARQDFNKSQRMTVAQVREILEQVKGRTSAVSMYYYGDPMVHRDMDDISAVISEMGMNSHVSTNYSFKLSDERIRSIVTSGLTHLTVCVDGLTQETYAITRIGGKIDQVLDNLERTIRFRNELGRVYPKVEVQYIRFQHNVHEYEEAEKRLKQIGIDELTTYWGNLHSMSWSALENYETLKHHDSDLFPKCMWPWVYMLVKYDGDVIPCCNHRVTEQYTKDPSLDRSFGNVFEDGVMAVWNSEKYRQARRLAAKPARVASEPCLEGSFCNDCPKLFETTKSGRGAQNNQLRDLYPHVNFEELVKRPYGKDLSKVRVK
jgi:MoaA/NifB/PqqE/SkfB family radical SAM enzyme